MARRFGSHSFGKHGAQLLTENREEQVNRHTSWTGSQPTPPTAVTSHAPGEEALSREIGTDTDRTVRSRNDNSGIHPGTPRPGRTGDAIAVAITQAAAHLVARHQDATVGAVAQATGVARGTIYRYFPTRQALLTAVVDQALLKAEHRLPRPALQPRQLHRASRGRCGPWSPWATTSWCWFASGCSPERTSRPVGCGYGFMQVGGTHGGDRRADRGGRPHLAGRCCSCCDRVGSRQTAAMRTRRPRSAAVARAALAGFCFPPEVIVPAVRW
jgi:AcrR family transcriptional regulator